MLTSLPSELGDSWEFHMEGLLTAKELFAWEDGYTIQLPSHVRIARKKSSEEFIRSQS